MNLFRVRNEETPENQTEYVENGKIYNAIFTFREGALTMVDLFKRSKKKKCNRYELQMEECLETHKLVYHGDQQFEDEHRPIEYSCKKKNKKLKCRTLIETNILEKSKYRDKKGIKYQDIESFRNRTNSSTRCSNSSEPS